ncbi:carboxypeptidase-like regulatory domain-containing protein [Labilibaculum sp. DW002]|uniref:Carboxypeptidase-like regulatory domain-containing protein n=1 Tax=Paralabilibaculum antarcticum TaxID=2912572 RepID=A0ABT5VTC1_9BACT|nr:carboxypeptidase-like regulatory domain-containing protein [Labilibaculum sp. DW002]MDE5418668.1 carboxypeptidase-like regulatory domain-containing protein [Labilibaculum sp. DW002]
MKKLLLLLLLVGFHFVSYNQVIIKGTIFEKKTNEKVCFATIYFNGTFVGTSSDKNGDFSLNIPHNTCMPLTISAIGYYSVTLPKFDVDKPIIVHLKPKAYKMRELKVFDKSLVSQRKANLKVFKRIFLGRTVNAMHCEITNEQDISFNYGSDRDTLKAFASKPILISNSALGYKITYSLNKFEYYRKSASFTFHGNIFFNEDMACNAADKQMYKSKRESTYLGSRMHFLRALWANDLLSAGFSLRNLTNDNLKSQDVIIQEACNLSSADRSNKKYLTYPTNLTVMYQSNSSEIILRKPKVFFNEVGFVELDISWEGEMVTRRMGDMLPYEYDVNE